MVFSPAKYVVLSCGLAAFRRDPSKMQIMFARLWHNYSSLIAYKQKGKLRIGRLYMCASMLNVIEFAVVDIEE